VTSYIDKQPHLASEELLFVTTTFPLSTRCYHISCGTYADLDTHLITFAVTHGSGGSLHCAECLTLLVLTLLLLLLLLLCS
jgi:hypothetical protein